MQTKAKSLQEAIVNTLVGLLFNFVINLYAMPLFGVEMSLTQNFGVVIMFTVLSVLRNYVVRRFFTKPNRFLQIQKAKLQSFFHCLFRITDLKNDGHRQ